MSYRLWKHLSLVKQRFANNTSCLNVTIYAPGDATALAPTQTTAWFRDALLKALSSNSLHGSCKIKVIRYYAKENERK